MDARFRGAGSILNKLIPEPLCIGTFRRIVHVSDSAQQFLLCPAAFIRVFLIDRKVGAALRQIAVIIIGITENRSA